MRVRPTLFASMILLAGPSSLYGCAGAGDSPESAATKGALRSDMVSNQSPQSALSDAVALASGQPIRRSDLQPLLLEIGGLDALTEVVLDLRLEAEAARAGIAITDQDLAAERSLLQTTLSPDPDTAVRLVDSFRTTRGLGPVRFEALLRRNALLRRLVQVDVEILDTAIRAQHEALHGEKRQARIITVADLPTAEVAVRRLQAGESFADVAVEVSTDSSAARGGLLQPITQSDSSYPRALRDALWSLDLGAVSGPIMLEESLAIIRHEKIIPADGVALEEVRDEVEKQARRSQERILMEELARRLIREADLTILDAELDRQWRDARGAQ